jgi:aminoglycoside phosphotransferase (APT) family kinase protein
MTLSAAAISWIERRMGGRVVEVEQQVRWRQQHFVTIDRGGQPLTILARGEREAELARRSTFLSHFDIAHEARVLEALQGHGLKVPELYGYDDEHRLILMERVDGTNLLAEAPDEATRLAVMKQYFEQLARLHSLDIESMTLDEIEIPTTPDDVAFAGKFRYMEDDYVALRPRLRRPEPLLDLGIWWLHRNVPQHDRPLSFLHGDTGPGQFMFSGDTLTALIDWELAHIGDPMLDLGVVRMRNMLYPTGPLREPIAHYERVSSRPIDWSVLSFYTVFTMLLTPMGVVESVQVPSVRIDSQMARYGWFATLRRGLCDAMAEALGLEIEPPALPAAPGADGSIAGYLTELLEVNCAPIARDAVERSHVDAAIALARTLRLESEVGAALLSDDLDDMASVLGRRPRDRAEGEALLDELVATDPADHLVDLVKVFGRIERRREYRWAPLMIAQESAPFERLVLA